MTEYLTVEEVLEIHDDQVTVYGGSAGLRDPGMLESALFRPQTGYYENILAEAAALWESLSQNHPFIDGNKRTAAAVAYTFLKINGWEARPEAWTGAVDDIAGLYERGEFRFDNLLAWLRQYMRQVDQAGAGSALL